MNFVKNTPLLTMLDQISQEIDNNKYSIELFLDLSKAFDTIDHHILLQKLANYGFKMVVKLFIRTYPKCVSLGDIRSESSTIRCGVP